MSKHGLGPGAFTYVADSAMVTKDNLKELKGIRFISRLPANYSACGKAIIQAVNANNWDEIGSLAEIQGSANRPTASYKAHEATVILHDETYRALVVRSDSCDKRRQKRLDKAIAKSEQEINAKLKGAISIYNCEADADADEALKKICKITGKLHKIEAEIASFLARTPGRPPKNKQPSTVTKYKIQWSVVEKSADVETERTIAGCFVLLSNVPTRGKEPLDAKELLRAYKGQYGVENNFAFMKDPIIVNDTFLKSPHRIDALGMVLVIDESAFTDPDHKCTPIIPEKRE